MYNTLKVFSYGKYVLNNKVRIKKDRIKAIKKFYDQFDKIENLSKNTIKQNGYIIATSRTSWVR